MNATRAGEEITLSGPPHSTSAVVRLEPGERVVPVMLKLPTGNVDYKAHIKPFGQGTSEIRLRLPRETPPGTYHGEGLFGGRIRGITVEVEPVQKLRVQPKQSSFSIRPGTRTEFSVAVVNMGNVPVEISGVALFDLDDSDGQDRALGRTLRATLGPDERRVDRFFEELRVDHGGEARVAVLNGVGLLEPTESRTLDCVLDVPKTVEAGRSYVGSWPLGNVSHVIRVEVANIVLNSSKGRERARQ